MPYNVDQYSQKKSDFAIFYYCCQVKIEKCLYHTVILLEADMRDLSCMQSDFYDLVFQAESLCYIPHVKEVFSQVSSLLKRGGRYRSAFHDPVAFSLEWDGVRYGLNRGYRQRELYREDGGVEFRHRLDEIFNGLLDEGFLIRAR